MNVLALFENLQSSGLFNSVSKEDVKPGGGGEGKAKPITLSSDDLKVARPEVIAALYGDRPLQCAQCGLRFSADAKKKHAAHLDWHFRRNTDKTKVASNFRQWQTTLATWLDWTEADEKKELQQSGAVDAKPDTAAVEVCPPIRRKLL